MIAPTREEDASLDELRYRCHQDGYEVDITFAAMLAARTIGRDNAIRGPMIDLPVGPHAVVFFGAPLQRPIATTVPRLLNAIGDDRTVKTIGPAPFSTARLLWCLAYVHAAGDCDVDVLPFREHPRNPAWILHVRGRDWRVGLMSMASTVEVKGSVRL